MMQLASAFYESYQGNSLENQKAFSDKGESSNLDGDRDSSEFIKSSKDSLQLEYLAKKKLKESSKDRERRED